MRQLVLLALVVGTALAAPQPAADAVPAEAAAAPCNDDGHAHIPDLPEGVRRPYSVRKRSRTVHHDQVAVTDDTPQLPPGQRRFDAVLPDEQGHDPTSSTPARRARGQRRQSLREDVDNEVAASSEPLPQEADVPARRRARRPAARPKKVVVVEENYPVNHPAFAEHDAKADAVVDSYDAVRRYPTHLPTDDGDDENLTSNDILGTPAIDQVALEDVPTASTEQRGIDNSVPAVDSDPDLPQGYRKFPKRTFSSDAGGSGDVLRVKPRKRVNQYQAPQDPEEQVSLPRADPLVEVVHEQRPAAPRPRPQAAPQPQPAERTAVKEVGDAVAPTGPGADARGRHRESHRVQEDEGVEPVQRRQPLRRRPVVAADVVSDPGSEQPAQPRRQQLRRRRPVPRPRPTGPADEDQVQVLQQDQEPIQQEHIPQRQRPLVRRRPRPRPVQQHQDDAQVESQAAPQDGVAQENAVAPAPAPQQRPARRRARPRPRPRPVAVEEVEVSQNLDNAVQTTASPPPTTRRRRPQAAEPRTVTEESFQVQQTGSRGHGRRLDSASSAQGLPQVQVEVEHDGTAKEGHEPTLVRSAVKKVPEGSHPGDPSPALIQKIVKNTLRRLKPQIAEHEGDVKVDILVKVIQVEDRK